jgi:hypothetical protein
VEAGKIVDSLGPLLLEPSVISRAVLPLLLTMQSQSVNTPNPTKLDALDRILRALFVFTQVSKLKQILSSKFYNSKQNGME